MLRARRPAAKALPPLLFFTDPHRTPEPAAVLARLPRGAGVVFRAFGAPDRLAMGRRLIAIARRRGLVFFVGGDIALATRLRADGLHLPERDTGRSGEIWRRRRRFILTAAAHSAPAVARARRAGVEAVIVSPVFASNSPSASTPLGTRRFAQIVRHAGLPCYALGGVNRLTARHLTAGCAAGLAAIEGLI